MKHVAFFGDGKHTFALPHPMMIELEHKAGVGIGALCTRVFNRHFTITDLVETIRLALIGGGKTPADAEQLVAAYARSRPLAEIYPLAVAILEVAYLGNSSEPAKAPEPKPVEPDQANTDDIPVEIIHG